MKANRTITTIAAAMLMVCMAGSAGMAYKIEQQRGTATLEEVLYIRSPQTVKFLSLGFTGLAADIYWTRAVQYFGGHHSDRAVRYDLLQPLLDLTTQLDPKLIVAYEFGSFFLAQKPPEGAGTPDAAVKFVERGIRENPGNWRLYYHLGFIQYIERKDFNAAADAFERGSHLPGAHPWMKVMAASMSQKGGDIQTARFLWSNIYASSQDKQIRENALVRLAALRIDDDVTHLQSLVESYRARLGEYPTNWGQVGTAGLLPGIPLDPSGTPYKLSENGQVLVQNPMRFPFIQKGLPKGTSAPEVITPEAFHLKDKPI